MPTLEQDAPARAAAAPPPPSERRRFRIAPVHGLLGAIVLAAAGFVGGVQVQKHHATSASTSAPSRSAFQAAGAGAGAAAVPAASGTVTRVSGSTIDVKAADGSTVKIHTSGATKVLRTARTGGEEIHPGDTVIVQGGASSSGTVTATSVTATASSGLSALRGAAAATPSPSVSAAAPAGP